MAYILYIIIYRILIGDIGEGIEYKICNIVDAYYKNKLVSIIKTGKHKL